jgi:hypothetical protein
MRGRALAHPFQCGGEDLSTALASALEGVVLDFEASGLRSGGEEGGGIGGVETGVVVFDGGVNDVLFLKEGLDWRRRGG